MSWVRIPLGAFDFSGIFSIFGRHIRVDLSDDEHLVRNIPCYVHVVLFPSFTANHNKTNQSVIHVDWSDFCTLNNNPVSLNSTPVGLNATQASLNKLCSG